MVELHCEVTVGYNPRLRYYSESQLAELPDGTVVAVMRNNRSATLPQVAHPHSPWDTHEKFTARTGLDSACWSKNLTENLDQRPELGP